MFKQVRVPLTRRDFEEIVKWFVQPGGYLQQRYGDLYVQFRDTGAGMALVEFLASIGHVFNMTAGLEVDEGVLTSARQPASVIELADSLGYDYIGPLPASCDGTLTIDYDPDLVIAAPILCATDPSLGVSVPFEILTDIQKPAGTRTVNVTFVQGESFSEQSITSDGQVGTRFDLSAEKSVILSSVIVQVNGVSWTRVSSFVDSKPSDRHFKVRFREDLPGSRVYFVEFGDGVNGLYPPSGTIIEISGRMGGGPDGNVPTGYVNQLRTTISDANGSSLTARIVSTEDAGGGTREESIEDVRLNAFRAIVTSSRTVGRVDYTLNAIAAGAKRAIALTRNESSMVPENTVLVVASKVLGQTLSNNDKESIRSGINSRGATCGTENLLVVSAAYYRFKVEIDVETTRAASLVPLKQSILDVLQGNDSNPSNVILGLLTYDGVIQADSPVYVLDVGQPVKSSWVTDVVDELEGVVSSEVRFYTEDGALITKLDGAGNTVQSSVVPGTLQIPQPVSITINLKRAGS
jgi:hypothetical protein